MVRINPELRDLATYKRELRDWVRKAGEAIAGRNTNTILLRRRPDSPTPPKASRTS